MLKLLLIAGGGGLGALLRHAVSGWAHALAARAWPRLADAGFPVGTLVVNVLGCLAIGGLAAYFAGAHEFRPEHRALVVVGLLGAFTTFSAFGYETFEMAHLHRQWALAGLNVLVANAAGLAAVWAGFRLVGALGA